MAVIPIWCTGRTWPNAPANARSGTVGRGPPHFIGVRWTSANGYWATFDNTIMVLQYAGVPTPGVNAQANWNWVDTNAGRNINMRNGNDANGFFLRFDIQISDFSGPQSTFFDTSAVPWFTWPSLALSTAIYTHHTGPTRWINDDVIEVLVLPYNLLPSGACKVWP